MKRTPIFSIALLVTAIVGLALTSAAEARSSFSSSSFSSRSSFSSPSFSRSSYGTSSSARFTSTPRPTQVLRPVTPTVRPVTPAKKVYPRPTTSPAVIRKTYPLPPTKPTYVSNNTGWIAFTALAAYMALDDADAPMPDTSGLAKLSEDEIAKLVFADGKVTRQELRMVARWGDEVY